MASRVRRTLVLAAVLVSGLAGLSGVARADGPAPPSWQEPTPPDGDVFTIQAGTGLGIALAAAGGDPTQIVHIGAVVLPAGARLDSVDGNPATAAFSWTPAPTQTGDVTLTFTASSSLDPTLTAPPRTIVVRVVAPPPPPIVLLSDDQVSRWAFVVQPTVARRTPAATARVVGRVPAVTPELLPNLVRLVAEQTFSPQTTWVRVQLAILPNGSTGWVPRAALGPYHEVRTRLVIDRPFLTATLFRSGRPAFRTDVGIGKPGWPTPGGSFYVRELLTGYDDPFYGPVAFGLNARSSVLTDWVGGGFIGIHGTNTPQLLPGRVSHGCVRIRNPAILRLRRLMPLGTPVTIR